MSTTNDSDAATPHRMSSQALKAARADGGRSATAEYEREQEAIAQRTATLKALRLAKEAEGAAEAAKPKPAARATGKKKTVALTRATAK